MDIIHRTNYWGGRIDFRSYFHGEHCLWFQASNFQRGCCRGYGVRRVPLTEEDFQIWGEQGWKLWRISIDGGNNPEHIFHKMMLVPFDTHGLGRVSCERQGWSYLSTFGGEPMNDLEAFLSRYRQNVNNQDTQNGNDDNINHLHMCIIQPEGAYLST